MWKIMRPDAEKIWKNKEILSRFSYYFAIINKKKIARYLITKKVPVSIELNNSTPLEKLWDKHSHAAGKFNKLFQELDTQQNSSKYLDSLDTPQTSLLDLKIELANRILRNCHFCERKCQVNREEKKGTCRLGADAYVSSWFHHMGEEAPLIPSGTIFFESCSFKCVFCQNYDISQQPSWTLAVNGRKLAAIANELAREKVKNINYVTPLPNTHVIIQSFKHQTENITQLWNSNMYCSKDSMKLLLELMDFWLPDWKYFKDSHAEKYSKVPHFLDVVTRNHKMVHDEGSGEMIIRHLVMPNHIECCTKPILERIAKECPKAVVNIMGQYRPCYQAHNYPEINRSPTSKELNEARKYATELGLLWEPVS
ncbi:MAG: pyruvate formate lyase-activating protein [Promethearchaeota archaeon]